MLFSLAIILICGFALGGILKKLRLPALLGMMAAGILLGPHALQLIDPALLAISSDLRQIALIVILLRTGLSLNIANLKKVGRPAILITASLGAIGIDCLYKKLLGDPLSQPK